MSKTAIIMSSYNGRAYIKDQVDSLLNQTCSDIKIYIRDDGSSDGTYQLLQELYCHEKRLTLLPDDHKNLGFGASFSAVMNYALSSDEDFDYFAFCDQDDYWEKDKIATAQKAMDAMDESRPGLFACNYYICDSDLKIQGTFCDSDPMDGVTFENLAFEGVFPGFTLVINRKLAQMAFSTNFSDIYYHDKWVSLIALGTGGQIVYEKKPLARYRRHTSAASSTDLGLIAKLKWRIEKVLKGDFCLRTLNMLRCYRNSFYDISSPEMRDFLDVFTEKSRLKKLTFKKRLRRSLSGELMLRLIILMGKI